MFHLREVLHSFTCLFPNLEFDFQFLSNAHDQLAAKDQEIAHLNKYKSHSTRLHKEWKYAHDAFANITHDLDLVNKNALIAVDDLRKVHSQIKAKQVELEQAKSQLQEFDQEREAWTSKRLDGQNEINKLKE